jgi:single-strand selective monofunctional uracil DNA glycosylase
MTMIPDSFTDALVQEVRRLSFRSPVAHVYNPLIYARRSYDDYWHRYGRKPKEVILLGMNPGPWGMTQTGVPFGEVEAVKCWLGISAEVSRPENEHPRRKVSGFACPRSEVSGKRLWGWARESFGTPANFFQRFFVANYCPLLFLEESGRNRTPNSLPAEERRSLFAACDRALVRMVEYLAPQWVVAVGKFAEERAREALAGFTVQVGVITHPSPANPAANRGWSALATRQLRELGLLP